MMNTTLLSVPDIDLEPSELVSRVKGSFEGLGYPQLVSISCEADGSTIYLIGKLSSYYLKQIAQTLAIKVPGVRRVVNNIEVDSDFESPPR